MLPLRAGNRCGLGLPLFLSTRFTPRGASVQRLRRSVSIARSALVSEEATMSAHENRFISLVNI